MRYWLVVDCCLYYATDYRNGRWMESENPLHVNFTKLCYHLFYIFAKFLVALTIDLALQVASCKFL